MVGHGGWQLAPEVETSIDEHLGRQFPWPGNFRELEQCVRNVVIRQSYHPPSRPSLDAGEQLARDLRAGKLTAEELLRRYCTVVYAQCGSYQAAARRLQLDRRTVQAKIDRALLESIR